MLLVLVACYAASSLCCDEQITLAGESYRVPVSNYVRSRNWICCITKNIRQNYSQLETNSTCICNAEFNSLYENVRLRSRFRT
jgi:hypothetical protein